MSDNRQMSVSRKRLVDFESMVTQYYNNTLQHNYTGVTTTTASTAQTSELLHCKLQTRFLVREDALKAE
jgi:hypothetical protein